MTTKTLAIALATLMTSLAIAAPPAAATDPNDQPYGAARFQFEHAVDHMSPARGRYSTDWTCWNGGCGPVIRLNQGDWVEYDVSFGYWVDKMQLWIPGFGSWQHQECTMGIRSALGNDYGTQTHACPNGDRYNQVRGHWYAIFFDSMFDSYTLRIECVKNCRDVGFGELRFQGFFREIEMKPLEITTKQRPVTGTVGSVLNGEYVTDTCVRVQVAGSPLYAVDYFRIDWGDGEETYATVPATWGKSFWDQTFCHSYMPTLGDYYLTVFAHDKLNRIVKRHAYVDWI